MNFQKIRRQVKKSAGRSAWSKGVTRYALSFLDDLQDWNYTGRDIAPVASAKICNREMLRKTLLNGAEDWNHYSWGGCSFVYDEDIAEQLCNPSELKKTDNGRRRPTAREDWFDVQARALFQACIRLQRIIFPHMIEHN